MQPTVQTTSQVFKADVAIALITAYYANIFDRVYCQIALNVMELHEQ